MSDIESTPKEGAGSGKKGWTDTEKAGLYFSIIDSMGGSIPWDKVQLPPGRTLKACTVMFGKEKLKVRAARDGADIGGTPSKKSKSSAASALSHHKSQKNSVFAGSDDEASDASMAVTKSRKTNPKASPGKKRGASTKSAGTNRADSPLVKHEGLTEDEDV